MDVIKQKKSSRLSKRLVYSSVLVFSIMAIGGVLASVDFNAKRVDRSKVMLGEVTSGDLDITVNSNGSLEPRNIEWLTAQVNGRVAEVLVKPGDKVEKGQVLLRMTNPALEEAVESAFSAWEGATANTMSKKVNLERDLLNQESVVLRAKFTKEKTQMEVIALRELGNASAAIKLRKAEVDLRQQEGQYEIEKKKYDKLVANAESMMAVSKASEDQLKNALTRARRQVANLEIITGIDGVVQEMPYKVGQPVAPGEQLGRVVQPEALYAELKVPALRSSEVHVGQRVEINTRVGYLTGQVERVDPTVVAGNVIVDVSIEQNNKVPVRPGLPVDALIYTAELKKVLYVDKPAFARANDTISLYRLDSDQSYAELTNVKVGKVSVNHIEVLGGLTAGDRIIVSDSSDWNDYSRILLN
ncbi:multidrug resistance efflux pump [Alteromonadaceae bacterium 2753L.S.0a.02]|nr:multidrug resistance efflux pump [Alteromonadaceae bacterium 2753L.S.0a.02]